MRPAPSVHAAQVTLVSDACCTYSPERQAASLAAVAGYCRQRTTAELLAELSGGSAATQQGGAGSGTAGGGCSAAAGSTPA